MTFCARTAAALVALGLFSTSSTSQDLTGPMIGFHYGIPLKWSATLALPLPFGSDARKPFIAFEPGIGGWRGSAGYFWTTGDLGSGYVARASLLRTGKRAWRAPVAESFLGAEFQYMPVFVLGVRVGGFMRMNSGTPKRGLFTVDCSLML